MGRGLMPFARFCITRNALRLLHAASARICIAHVASTLQYKYSYLVVIPTDTKFKIISYSTDSFNPYSDGIDFRRQNLTSVDADSDVYSRPRHVRVKIFTMVIDP